jgi:hypothetical protein
MTTSSAANEASANAWEARDATGWLALAASPTFGVMALIAANHAAPVGLCSSGSGILPIDGMAAMYLLMSLFHLSPWVKLVSGRPASGRPVSARPVPGRPVSRRL